MIENLKRTPLFAAHQKLGARMVPFGGWEMPVQYSGIVDEHQVVRRNAGIFDISHMGEVLVKGPPDLLNRVLTNDVQKLRPGQAQYTLMCNEQGGTIDDLYIYRLADDEFLLIINASRIEADVTWLQKHAPKGMILKDASAEFGAVAVQGPRAVEFIDQCFASKVTALKKNEVLALDWRGQKIYIARTGYTGEDGFEVVAPAACIVEIWDGVLAKGHAHCLQPCGLGARDTLRTEVCYPLYGHELDETTTPIEAGVGFFVALDKGPFIGRDALARQKENGVTKKCVAFKMTDKSAPPRPGYAIWSSGEKVGIVTSGTQSPSLGIGIGLGYVPPAVAKPSTPIEIEIRGKTYPAITAVKPLYHKQPA